MPRPAPGRLCRLDAEARRKRIADLGLSTRAFRCLGRLGTVSELLRVREDELMAGRNFGRACLVDVRRRVTRFALDALGVPEGDAMRVSSTQDHPAVLAVWEAPPQPKPLGEVIEEILELLARGDQLRANDNGRRPVRVRQPSQSINFDRATLAEVAEFVFAPLRPREREVLERRFSTREPEAPSLADLGGELGLTRERVRQILAAALGRLSQDTEQQRRAPLTRYLETLFGSRGGVLNEETVRGEIRKRFSGRRAAAFPVTRAVLETTPGFTRCEAGIWCGPGTDPAQVRAAITALRAALCRGRRPYAPKQLGVACRRAGASHPDVFIQACLAASDEFRTFDGGQVGLREWEWGVPKSLEECLVACLRTQARPQPAARLTEHVNRLLPPEEPAAHSEVLRTLGANPAFRRVRTGTYGLAEWPASEEK